MSIKRSLASAMIAITLIIGMCPSISLAITSTAGPMIPATSAATMYRLYNPNSGEHFYTKSTPEKDDLKAAGWKYEGIAWMAPKDKNSKPVYRMYNANAGDHHYTMSSNERKDLEKAGWKYEGIGWYSDEYMGRPLYRLYNPNAKAGSHHYTTSTKEKEDLKTAGWRYEGIGWYGVITSSSNPGTNPDPNPGNPGKDPEPGDSGNLTESEKAVKKVKGYTYRIWPVNGTLNNMFFVETDNPDPYSIQFVDENSKYLGRGETSLIKPLPRTYSDVVYTNAETRRIADKGYLFYNYECDNDGGQFKLMANIGYYHKDTDFGSVYNDGTNYETGVKVSCPDLEDRADYLIRSYASGASGFFDKLDAVQAGLDSIALYPKDLKDTDKPRASGYPALATSPYPELGLNKHIELMYENGDPLFIDSAYGFVLDSLGVPGMMGSVARRIDPSCTVSSGWSHAYVEVSLNGESKSYGGAGTGSTHPIYSKFTERTFRFDGTDRGYGTNLSMDVLRAKRLEYASLSDAFAQQALDKLSNKAVSEVVGDGAWILVGVEGSSYSTLAYAAHACDGTVTYASDAWVDGRYVNSNERYVPDAKFSDHPTADIILHGVDYVDRFGTSHKATVVYEYDEYKGYWHGFYYYTGNYWYDSNTPNVAPSSLILTREQVDEMVRTGQLDANTSVAPTPQYVYNGTAEPGTPYASGMSLGTLDIPIIEDPDSGTNGWPDEEERDHTPEMVDPAAAIL